MGIKFQIVKIRYYHASKFKLQEFHFKMYKKVDLWRFYKQNLKKKLFKTKFKKQKNVHKLIIHINFNIQRASKNVEVKFFFLTCLSK